MDIAGHTKDVVAGAVDLGRHACSTRFVEGLVTLELVVFHHESDVVQLDLVPQVHGEVTG